MRPAVTTLLETFTGRMFNFFDPQPEQISVKDIARALSLTCRFAGHVDRFYSVAEHALHVRNLVVEAGHPELALPALHHDSHEAYLGDWPTPLKVAVGATFLNDLQRFTDSAIALHFGFPPALFTEEPIREADVEALFREAATLKPSEGCGPFWGREVPAERLPEWAGRTPAEIEAVFLQTHWSDMDQEPCDL